jgi:hypothetical protein
MYLVPIMFVRAEIYESLKCGVCNVDGLGSTDLHLP